MSRARNVIERPTYILDDVWEELEEKKKNPFFKKRSETMRANRWRASTHTGGSRSFANHADLLKKELKVDDIPAHTLFQHNHSQKHDMKMWISAKAHQVEGLPGDENAIFLKVVGGIIRG